VRDLKDVKPKTLEGLKRLAKSIAKRDGIGHAAALDKAAEQAGYVTYNVARRKLI
jgi:hypothetical protein